MSEGDRMRYDRYETVGRVRRGRFGVWHGPFGLAGSVLLTALTTHAPCRADNPIVQTIYTADPAPLVHDGTVYLYTSHDEDVTVDDFFTMNDWWVFSSEDMVNWTDHGSPLSYESFSWATGKAWAPHGAERNGKFYLYVPVAPNSIGVAVADSPTGPFTDPLGEPLITGSHEYIDPTVFVDGDGQAYLYFGNPRLWYVELNEDMISYSGPITEVPQTAESFGQRDGDPDRPTLYEEGPWFYKRGDLYYMLYAAGGIPEDIAYSTSPGPTGPWTYQGIIMENEAGHAFTNHAGAVDFKGRSFFFYHTQELPGGGGFKRSVAVEEFTYEPDGSFPSIGKTTEGVSESVDPLDPYQRVEGETMAWGSGVEVEDCSEGGRNVSEIESEDYIKVEDVDFGSRAIEFEARVACGSSGGSIEVRLDALDGALVATCAVEGTGGWQEWTTITCPVTDAVGQHDLFLLFTGGEGFLFNLDWWRFVSNEPPDMGGVGGVGGSPSTPSTASGGSSVGASGASLPPTSGGSAMGTGGASGGLDGPNGCSCKTALGSGERRSIFSWLALLLPSLALLRRRRRDPALGK